MTKSQNERDGWQKVKQALDRTAAAGTVDDVKVRVLYKPNAQQTPVAVEITYRVDGQQFVRTFRATSDEADSSPETHTEIDSDTVTLVLRELMAQGLPAEWAVARAVAEMDGVESGLTYGQYKADAKEAVWHSFDTDYRLCQAFDALRQQLQSSCGEAWATAQATLTPNGSLVFSFSYNTSDEP
ncbi:MAG: hypothetical protein ACOYNY_13045 [Caldilineaceae bacterium]